MRILNMPRETTEIDGCRGRACEDDVVWRLLSQLHDDHSHSLKCSHRP